MRTALTEAYLRELPARLAKFGLALAEEKSALVKFNRRSQRKSFTWAAFAAAWERWKIPVPRVIEKPWPRTAGQYRPDGI